MARSYFRKSKKVGPFRVTASKSGLSYSVGSKYARVTKRADGKTQSTVGVPGTGFRHTSLSKTRTRQSASAGAPTSRPKSPAPTKLAGKAIFWTWLISFLILAVILPSDLIWLAVVAASGATFGIVRYQKQRVEAYFTERDRQVREAERARQERLEALSRIRPKPRLFKTAEEAEGLAKEWMMYFGFVDAEVTRAGPDAGVDVDAADAIAQVKAWTKTVGRPVVQQTYGAASAAGKRAVLFALGGYTRDAVVWADEYGVALFEFNHAGMVEVASRAGLELMSLGDRRATS